MLGGFQTRDLAQITDDMIAWQESGYSTDGMALPPVFAVVRLIASTIDQLDLTVDGGPVPEWLRSPRRYGSALDQGDLIQWTVTSMALHGAAYLRCVRTGESWRVDALHPGSVQTVASAGGIVRLRHVLDDKDIEVVPPVMAGWVQGEPYILHVPYLVTPQFPAGVSPVRVARESLLGYFAVERQAATLLGRGTYSGGRLETDQDITPATALRYQDTWITNRESGRLPVLGAGLRYVNDLINPADAQWLESRQFNAQQVAQMFGVPPSLLGMTSSGGNSSLSYSNAQDNRGQFRSSCLEGFTSQIEDALTMLMPPGRGEDDAQTVRFDYDTWEGMADAPTDDGL